VWWKRKTSDGENPWHPPPYKYRTVDFIERSGRKPTRSALDCASYRHRIPQGTMWSLVICLNEPSVLVERWPGLKEFQATRKETEKAAHAKVVETGG